MLDPLAIGRAIKRQGAEQNRRADKKVTYEADARELLEQITDPMKNMVSAQFLAKRTPYEKGKQPGADYATINQHLLEEFENAWKD